MSDALIELNRSVNAVVWGFPAVAAIVGVGSWRDRRPRRRLGRRRHVQRPHGRAEPHRALPAFR